MRNQVLIVTLVLVHLARLGAAQIEMPPVPFWHFAVRSADLTTVMIIFSKDYITPEGDGPFPQEYYQIQSAPSLSFANPTDIPGPYLDTGTALLATTAGWSGTKRPYYRVRIVDYKGKVIAQSASMTAFDQEGNIFVVNDTPTPGSSTSCGDFAASPCPDIETALQVAPAGSTIYVTPGIYTGTGNTNLTFGGKPVTLQATNGPDITMIDCNDYTTGDKTRAFTFASGEGRDSIVAGFTIANGASEAGGCVSITGSAPTIKGSRFLACNATTGISRGGAIYAFGNPTPGPLVQNTSFIFNWGLEGGAIYVGGDSEITVEDSLFEWNICPTAVGRGGSICADMGNITVANTIMRNGIVGFGGGAIMLERGSANIEGLTAYNNSASNFGGGFLVFGSEMKISKSNITSNRGNIFAGGLLATSSIYEANDTIHNDNWARVGGGAIKLLGGQGRLKNCTVNGNSATYGAGFDVSKQGDLLSMLTELVVEDTEVMNNVVTDRGAGFYLDSYDTTTFKNVRFKNNTATKGGGGFCVTPSTRTLLTNVTFEENVAQYGGGLFLDEPCRLDMNGAIFRRNVAVEAGAGIATGDGVVLNINGSLFDSNGVSNCTNSNPPISGAGLMVGVQQFKIEGDKCSANDLATPTKVNLKNTIFVGNIAAERGGGINIESGILTVDGCELENNRAVGGSDGANGIGGGLAITERCPIGTLCSTAVVNISNSIINGNGAHDAGGGLHYFGGSPRGSLSITKSIFSSNYVDFDSDKSNAQEGVGGGIFLGRHNFTISEVSMLGNEAYYGGGMFISASLEPIGAKLSKINATHNRAFLGSAAYWLRSASPNASLPLNAFNISLAEVNGTIATEVLQVEFAAEPPVTVQSAEPFPPFSVAMLDYYGNLGVSELGSCTIISPNITLMSNESATSGASDLAPLNVRPLGSEVGVAKGEAVFSQLEVTGTIGQSYELNVDCTPNTLGRSPFLNLTGESLPALSLPVYVAPCRPGKEPKSTGEGSICVDCPFNTFNTDGLACQQCPEGALCAGGDQISSKDNYWRSAPNSTSFYSCREANVCEAGPETGKEACIEGHVGPLCAVCQSDWFAFGGRCRSCNSSGQAKLMLALSVILIAMVVVLIFVRSWEFGTPGTPGIMTKVKILITHLQILALFRDYDVVWPDVTASGFSWFDTFNVGLGMMAPSCFVGDGYSFWVKWISQMVMPVGAVAFCSGIYWCAEYALKKRRATAAPKVFVVQDGSATSGVCQHSPGPSTSTTPRASSNDDINTSKGFDGWLEDLKIRCWKNAFWLVTLLYPRSSMTALQMFGTQTLDSGTYLTADYSIMVKAPGEGYSSTYIRYLAPGAVMLVVFAAVIPYVWWWVIHRNRKNLDDPTVAKKYGFLYGSYRRQLPYWETLEALRKFSFAFIPVFVKPNSVGSVQGTVGQIVAGGYLIATVWLRPFAKAEDNYLQIASQCVLFLVLLSGCTAKWAEISSSGLKGLAAAQLFLSSAVAFAICALIVFSIRDIVRRSKEKKAAKKAEQEANGVVDAKKKGALAKVQKSFNSILNLKVRAGPDVEESTTADTATNGQSRRQADHHTL